jgi:hypothetical protein
MIDGCHKSALSSGLFKGFAGTRQCIEVQQVSSRNKSGACLKSVGAGASILRIRGCLRRLPLKDAGEEPNPLDRCQ